jgi:hypothetical protein
MYAADYSESSIYIYHSTQRHVPECSCLYMTKIYILVSYNFLYVVVFNDTVSIWKCVVCNSRSLSEYCEIKELVLICGNIPSYGAFHNVLRDYKHL